jgi:S-disulfanyl-L-cysteine oxidoreductase SoxD
MSPARIFRLLLTIGLLQQVVFGQAASHEIPMRDGVYTVQQAEQGKLIYQDQCSMCHGDSLEGSGRNSALAGAEFLNRWTGQTVADLFMKTIVMMPAMDPGTMTPKDTAAVIAYILSENKYSAGKAELSTDPRFLEMIPIVKP